MPLKRGGPQPGSGRPKGSKNAATIERERVAAEVQLRRYRNAHRIFNAQLNLAEGCTYVYEIVETGEGKSKKREHVIVADPMRIKEFLDNGNVEGEGNYMFITTEKPDGKMIADIFDRAFGKPAQAIEMTVTPPDDTRDLEDHDIDSELADLRAAAMDAGTREDAASGEVAKEGVN